MYVNAVTQRVDGMRSTVPVVVEGELCADSA